MTAFFSSISDETKHWIDVSFEKSNWKTNADLNEIILKHLNLWMTEITDILTQLQKKLKDKQKERLIESQEYWTKHIEADRKFIYSFDDLQMKIGKERYLEIGLIFMNKIKQRCIELQDILNYIVEEN